MEGGEEEETRNNDKTSLYPSIHLWKKVRDDIWVISGLQHGWMDSWMDSWMSTAGSTLFFLLSLKPFRVLGTGALMTSLKLKRCGWFLWGLGRMSFFFLWLFYFFPSVWFVGFFLFYVCSCCSFGFLRAMISLGVGRGTYSIIIEMFFFICPPCS